MPKIIRKVPYTLAAYSGGIIKNTDKIQQKLMPLLLDMMEDEPRPESPIDPSKCVTNAIIPTNPPPPLERITQAQLYKMATERYGYDYELIEQHLKGKQHTMPTNPPPPLERNTKAQLCKMATERYGYQSISAPAKSGELVFMSDI